jgi:glyoxylase-like metal-dependent hydrolase (beta-lactamase superfamily II)
MNIHPLDLNYQNIPRATAAYLVSAPGGPVLVETGPASTLDTLKARLAEHGHTPADVRHVLVTHIHLDHAGAAGWWAQQGAQVYVHHVGARHLVDPSRLLASARRIYGEAMDQLWGQTLPAPAEQVRALHDGDVVQANGLTFTALDTPGHARHHLVFLLGQVAFTGDAAGVRMPGSDFISIPAVPPEFDLQTWQETVTRLLDLNLSALYPTHYGLIENVREHLQALSALLDEAAQFVRTRMQAGLERDALVEQYTAWQHQRAQSHGFAQRDLQRLETANPTFMSADGLMRYWHKRAGL